MPEGKIEYSQKQRILEIKSALGETQLLLEKFSGMESVSAPFEFDVTLLSPLESVNLKKATPVKAGFAKSSV